MTHRLIRNVWFLLAWICLALSVVAEEVPENPLGEDFQINTFTPSYQIRPEVGIQPNGFVVVWSSEGSSQTDSDSFSIHGQRYDSDGLPVGEEFQVNTYTTGRQDFPAVAVASTGDFVVVWDSAGSGGDDNYGTSIQGQRFSSDGLPLGGEFQVNTYTSSNQRYPEVAIDSSGCFVVVWEGTGSEGIQGQWFFADGTPSGTESSLAGSRIDDFRRPDVAVTANGNAVVVWQFVDLQRPILEIQRTTFPKAPLEVDSIATISEIDVSTDGSIFPSNAKVSADANGNFVVVWEAYCTSGPDMGSDCIRGRRFSADNVPLSAEFQINTHTPLFQSLPAVAVEPDGDFIVTWTSESSGGDDSDFTSVQGRRFDAAGVPRGEDFQVNSVTVDYQLYPALTTDARGDFIIVWQSRSSTGSDTEDFSVQGRRFAPSKVGLLFEDGFESGDTSAWSVP